MATDDSGDACGILSVISVRTSAGGSAVASERVGPEVRGGLPPPIVRGGGEADLTLKKRTGKSQTWARGIYNGARLFDSPPLGRSHAHTCSHRLAPSLSLSLSVSLSVTCRDEEVVGGGRREEGGGKGVLRK
jgi:hypothetical protein